MPPSRPSTTNEDNKESTSISETLQRLFPSTRGRSPVPSTSITSCDRQGSRGKRFEPYSKGKGKTTSTRGKSKATSAPVLKDVILLPNPKMSDVPRGKTREELYVRKLVYPAFEFTNEMSSSEIIDRLSSFFQRRLKGKYFEIVRSVGNKIVAAGVPQESINGRVIKHFSGQGPVYLRCVSPMETDFDWVSDDEEDDFSDDENDKKNDVQVINDDKDNDNDLLKPIFLPNIASSSNSASDPLASHRPSTSAAGDPPSTSASTMTLPTVINQPSTSASTITLDPTSSDRPSTSASNLTPRTASDRPSTSASTMTLPTVINRPSTSASQEISTMPVPLQNCPSCNGLFPMSEIEEHADFCCSKQGVFDSVQSNIIDTRSVVDTLSHNVDSSSQIYVVVRRGCPLERALEIWKRAVRKSPLHLNQRVLVGFSGEQGIDSGAVSAEFYTLVLSDMAKTMFKNGAPVDSIFHVQNLNFRTCGQIVAASLSQGGPPPCFLDESAYDLMVKGSPKLHDIDWSKHLTETDRVFLNSVKEDVLAHLDTIVDHGYTGKINDEYKEEIVATMAITIITKRLVYLNEFLDGMQSFGLADIIKTCPAICKSLFIKSTSSSNVVDANYVFSILQANYSPRDTSRRNFEEAAMDMFQDLLFRMEDEDVRGCEEAALPYEEGSTEVVFQKPDLTPAGVLGWLTGQKHKPLGGEDLKVSVTFDHDCLKNNPEHKICYPVVGACAKEIILPMAHMKNTEQFNDILITAMSFGQSFGKA
ncbi:uncharacterized protein LOC114575961 [Exaiptasia diaphana]|uniref:HECT domain-containing protein n=1 Tax=Exaiptasia diaphana TaxID=2652724 RepID=A0A913YQ53_EXADI|nr:uncharacterized protein LOC114575961 [Exaiptasia diaphana]